MIRKNFVQVLWDWCKGCKMCMPACPHGLLVPAEGFNKMGYNPVKFNDTDNKCTGCKNCTVACPDVALYVYRTPKKETVGGAK